MSIGKDGLDKIDTIYYRGFLKSCNYRCGYCPFSKKTMTKEEIQKDEADLIRFISFISNEKQIQNIFFVPYGEGLIHDHFWEGIAQLVSMDWIKSVGIQTNASFPIEMFKKHFPTLSLVQKLHFWCTYHPTEVSVTAFVQQIHQIVALGAKVCVGAVAVPATLNQIKELLDLLHKDIDLWLNPLDGMKTSYKDATIDAFFKIDPLFPLQYQKIKSDYRQCRSGKTSIFVRHNGEISSCNISRDSLGNLYQGKLSAGHCHVPYCGCYLAYSNRKDCNLSFFYKEPTFRYREKNDKEIYFFDIDGTITDQHGKIMAQALEKIRVLSKDHFVFFNTALPMDIVRRKHGDLLVEMSGGVFSNGAHLYLKAFHWHYYYLLDASICDRLDQHGVGYIKQTNAKGQLMKILVPNKKHLLNIPLEDVCLSTEKNRCYITNPLASKCQGAQRIVGILGVRKEKVFVYGNSENDEELMAFYRK